LPIPMRCIRSISGARCTNWQLPCTPAGFHAMRFCIGASLWCTAFDMHPGIRRALQHPLCTETRRAHQQPRWHDATTPYKYICMELEQPRVCPPLATLPAFAMHPSLFPRRALLQWCQSAVHRIQHAPHPTCTQAYCVHSSIP